MLYCARPGQNYPIRKATAYLHSFIAALCRCIAVEWSTRMKNKRTLIIAIGIAALVILMAALYPPFAEKKIINNTYAFLFEDGYTESEISSVDARHSYMSGLLGYGEWHTSIFFADEPDVEYHCILTNDIIPKITTITAGGFSSNLPDHYEPLHYPQ